MLRKGWFRWLIPGLNIKRWLALFSCGVGLLIIGISLIFNYQWLAVLEDIVLAFSGGVDSSLLLKICCDSSKNYGTTVYAITVHTELHPMKDVEIATKVAKEAGAKHLVVYIDELQDAGIEYNPIDRCYRCKSLLFGKLKEKAKELGVKNVVEGTNEDDLHVYRPGLKAVRELGVYTPLADCGLTKKEVRKLAGEYGISVAERPSSPCLATRLPYGTEINLALLEKIDRGEQKLRNLGFGDVRIRVHGTILRLEINPEDFPRILEKREEILLNLREVGCPYITLDIEGFRSGSMDI